MIRVTTDSTSDLPKDLLEKHKINVIPLFVMLGDDEYLDGINIDEEKIFQFVKETNILPKTAARSIADYVDFFNDTLKEADVVIHIGLGAEISSSYRNALLAGDEIGDDKVFVVDSKSLCNGIGILVLEAVQMAESGADAKVIINHIEKLVDKIQASFVVEKLDYLYKGGRCSKFSFSVGSLLTIRPKLELSDGKIVNTSKDMGPMKMVYKKFIDEMLRKHPCAENETCFLANTIQNEVIIDELYEYLNNKNMFKRIYRTKAGSVITSHCGPGTLGIFYIEK